MKDSEVLASAGATIRARHCAKTVAALEQVRNLARLFYGGLSIIFLAGTLLAQPSFRSVANSVNTIKNAADCEDTSVVANTITCSTNVGFTGYNTGQAVDLHLLTSVTGAATININALGAKAVTYNGATALVSGIMSAGGTYRLQYDGTRFVLQGTVNTASGSGTVSAGTQNQVAKYAANGSTVSGSPVLSDDGSNAFVAGRLDIQTNSLVIEIPNSGSPGTTVNKLAKIPQASASVLTTSAADQISAVGVVVAGAGTTGNAQIGIVGQFSCLFDNTATTAGDFIVPSSATAGTCSDGGTGYPASGEVLGQVLSTHAACGSPPCGPYTVLFGTPDIFLPGSGGSNGNNGGGNGNGAKQQLHVISFVIDGAGAAIATGALKDFPTADFACTINRIDISADQSGSITVDVWKRATAIPTSGNKISASAPLTLSAAQLAQNGSLTGWTKSVSVGDVFGFSVATASTVTHVVGQIWCQ